jgi:transposase
MGMERDKKLARQRAVVILRVRSGAITARQGARRLGVSRKTYYEWEERALRAMALALENRPVGRPAAIWDEKKEDLRARVKELEKKLYLAEKTIEVKEMLSVYEEYRAKKKAKTERKSGKRG